MQTTTYIYICIYIYIPSTDDDNFLLLERTRIRERESSFVCVQLSSLSMSSHFVGFICVYGGHYFVYDMMVLFVRKLGQWLLSTTTTTTNVSTTMMVYQHALSSPLASSQIDHCRSYIAFCLNTYSISDDSLPRENQAEWISRAVFMVNAVSATMYSNYMMSKGLVFNGVSWLKSCLWLL